MISHRPVSRRESSSIWHSCNLSWRSAQTVAESQLSFHDQPSVRSLLPLGISACVMVMLIAVITATEGGYAQTASTSFDDLAAQAAAARDRQDISLAIALYRRAEELRPDWVEGWWNIGLLSYKTGQPAPAIEALNRLLAIAPTATPAIALRGLSEFETGAYDDALRDLEQGVSQGAASDQGPGPILRYRLGLLLTRAGRFPEAMAQYKALARSHEADRDLCVAIGMAGMRVPSLPAHLNPQEQEFYETAGRAGYAMLAGDNNGAEVLFQQLFARYPSIPNLHYFYGMLLFPNDGEMASAQFQKEITVDPSNEAAMALLAFTLMSSGRYSEALPLAKRALAAAPGTELAQLTVGRSLIETGDEAGGMEMLQQVLLSDPKSLEAHVGLVAAYSRAGRTEDAYRERIVCLGLVK